MNYEFISDTHIHSDSFYNTTDTVIKICEQASKLGLYSITIITPFNFDDFSKTSAQKIIKQTSYQIKKAQNIFGKYINVFTGIELNGSFYKDESTETSHFINDFDFVLAKITKLKNSKNFSKVHFNNENVNYILNRYFEELIELIKWGKFDSLSGLTYPLKCISQNANLKIDTENIKEKLKKILEELAKSQKALDVNCHALKASRINYMLMHSILSTFKKVGGQYLTFGSHAHSHNDVGFGVREAIELAYNTGFDNLSVFKNRFPHLLSIA